MKSRWLGPVVLAAAGLTAAACGASAGSSGSGSSSSQAYGSAPSSSAPAASGTTVGTAMIGGKAVLANAKGFTLYWFVPDTASKSNCNGSCATFWPPVKGPVTAGSGVTGRLGTITRADGSTQATYNGHPLYTYVGDHAPGQAAGNGLNASGGLWYEVTATGGAAPAPSQSSGGGGYNSPMPGSGGGGGYGGGY